MHIQEVVIDGFKSYAHKTVITGFDPHFNAITGLNGSGKSNILDSICFVLGISNLSHVRAGNLSELVYKQGQAGITKASVTIVFDNSDETTSPVGYEQNTEVTVTRQVLIGGKSKYFINGKVQTLGQVTNLFHSVQLNVNNPHFLIMQGRITKVLNMKPNEILGMVEEAAGTRMYETKRVAALKTIDKKQMKLDELNNILAEEITPTLERLRGEKQHYLKWSKNNADIERIERFVVGYDYLNAEKVVATSTERADAVENEMKQKEERLLARRNEVVDKEHAISALSSKLHGEFDESYKKVKSTEESLSKALVKATSAWQNSVAVAKDADSEFAVASKSLIEITSSVSKQEEEMQKEAQKVSQLKSNAENAEKELLQLQEDYQNMCAGISSDDVDASLPDQISKAHMDANTAEGKSKQAKMKIAHLTKSVKSMEKNMLKEEAVVEKLSAKKNKAAAAVDAIRIKVSKLHFSEDKFDALDREKTLLENSLSSLQDTIEGLTAQLNGRLSFKYSDPVRGFDRSKVKGLIARLVSVKHPETATALEIVGGGMIYQVVVDEAITGKALLSKGKLQRRVTIIPLDKITPRRISAAACDRANTIAKSLGSKSSPAIELVGFDEEIRNAIEYVFGSALVVDGMNAANQICDATKTRTVTMAGDVFNPEGTISGGSNKNLGTTLARLTKLSTVTRELKEKTIQLDAILRKWEDLKSLSKNYGKLSNELELRSIELSAVEKHLSQTTYGMLAEKYAAMSKEIEEAKSEMVEMNEEKQQKWALYNELKEKEEVLTSAREAKLKNIDKTVNNAKKKAVAADKFYRKAESEVQKMMLELTNLNNDVAAAKETALTADKAKQEEKLEERALQIKVTEQKSIYDEAKRELDEKEKQIADHSNELKNLSQQKAKLNKKAETEELEKKKLSIKVEKIRKEKVSAERFVVNMLKKYSWIANEKDAFGVQGSDYDFGEVDPNAMSSKLKGLKDEQASLVKKINKKVMGMIEKAEGEYTELLRKRKVVENDKKKIQAVIEELDTKKKSELERTWVKVNRDFGAIFSALLPGAAAKLEPPEGMEGWQGLEVKVAFGDTWKESLSELSGGQRSLLALSLILSMLLFKPAPMYILDEVDAALDLSHTQNIGNMLKTHFSQSQFIVVSLKEGMFNNANVIFRTKFVDGVSTVSKTIGVGASAKGRALAEAAVMSNASSSTGRKRRASGRGRQTTGKEN